MAAAGEITELLVAARKGDRDAMDQLIPLVHTELRAVARRQLRGRRPGQTLETTALVNEAYVKLADGAHIGWQDRNHFFSVAAVAMRHIIVDYARQRIAKKRGGNQRDVTLDEGRAGANGQAVELVAIDEALHSLSVVSERLSQVVELRFFAGMTVAETAATLAVSERTVKRDWRAARAFLYQALSDENGC